MAGGIAILLLVIVLLVAGAIALALYGTGGVLWHRKTDPAGDRAESPIGDAQARGEHGRRPQHLRPRTTAQQRTDFVGGGRSAQRRS
jgi:hypothetical protein